MVQCFPDTEVSVDALEFEELPRVSRRRATSPAEPGPRLYRGDLLPEDLYEDWAAQPRVQLDTVAASSRCSSGGRTSSDVDPGDEPAHLELMRPSSCKRGPLHGALRQFDRLDRTLRTELGVQPSREAVQLRDRSSSAGRPQPRTRATMVGRPGRAGGARSGARRSQRRGGPDRPLSAQPGIGKTTSCAPPGGRRQRGWRVGVGAGASIEGAWAYAPSSTPSPISAGATRRCSTAWPTVTARRSTGCLGRGRFAVVRRVPPTPVRRRGRAAAAPQPPHGRAADHRRPPRCRRGEHPPAPLPRQATTRERLVIVVAHRLADVGDARSAPRRLLGRQTGHRARPGALLDGDSRDARCPPRPRRVRRAARAHRHARPWQPVRWRSSWPERAAEGRRGSVPSTPRVGGIPSRPGSCCSASPSSVRPSTSTSSSPSRVWPNDEAYDHTRPRHRRSGHRTGAAGYRFRHRLVRDALLEVPPHRRRRIHRDTADRLEALGALTGPGRPPPDRAADETIAAAGPYSSPPSRPPLSVPTATPST